MDVSVDDKTLSKEILSKLEEEINSGICQELNSVWSELWDKNEMVKRQQILAIECQKEIKDFLREVLTGEKKVRDEYVERIEGLLDELNELQRTLQLVIPYEDVASLPLHTMAAHLNKKAEKYRIMRNERVHKLNELAQKEAELCEKLGTVRQITDMSEVPTLAKIKVLENQINAMEHEKVNRMITFLEQRQDIINLYNKLGTKPLLKFETDVVSEKEVESFLPTNENMKKLSELQLKLKEELQEAQQQAKTLVEKLKLLWNYVGEAEEHQEKFLAEHKTCTAADIASLKEEIARCEAKKRENISEIVKRIRQVLVGEWDRCLIGTEEREKFRPFKIDCFTEDLCELHELEIERLRSFYAENEQIFVLIAQHERLFNRLLNLETGSKDANRYNNRGGLLLQEEKERKLITKELPIVEEELRSLLKKYEEEHGNPFTSFGVPMELILDEQWKAHFDQKTIEKLMRKKTEKKGKTPLGKRNCNTPCASLSANKVPKLNSDKKVSSTTKHVTPRIPGRNVALRRRKPDENNDCTPPLVHPTTYDEFQSALQSKVESSTKSKKPAPRSTAVNEVISGVLRERNTPNKIRPVTPIKTTPAKISPPLCSPSAMKTPRTVPKARRPSQSSRLAPARLHFPIII